MNQEKIEKLGREILVEIGEEPDRVGLVETPKRIAKMYKEIFRGYDETQKPKVTVFPNGEDKITYTQMIVDKGDFNSYCEHHGSIFRGKYWFSYIPSEDGNLIGISKIARVIDYFASKMQIQERLTQEVVDYLWSELCKNDKAPPLGMALIMRASHTCKEVRGVKKKGWMMTSEMKGEFLKPTKGNPMQEFLSLINLDNGKLEI